MKIILLTLLLAFYLTGCCCLPCKTTVYYSSNGKPFPIKWGRPPEIQTKDYRPLPYGYGHGSSTLYNWIMENKHQVQKRINNLSDVGLLKIINGPDK
tara:strand:+ start:1301 stop:1591 length:291 start_codon:yes stop_codon:yes gene_type:complete